MEEIDDEQEPDWFDELTEDQQELILKSLESWIMENVFLTKKLLKDLAYKPFYSINLNIHLSSYL